MLNRRARNIAPRGHAPHDSSSSVEHTTGTVDHVSLVSGVLPWTLAVVAFGSAICTLLRAGRLAQAVLPLVFALACGVLVAASALLRLPQRVHGTFPPSFFVWFALPLTAAVVIATSARHLHARGVAIGAVGVVLLGAFALDRVDAFYGYYRTIGDLRGAPLPGQVAAAPTRPEAATRVAGLGRRTPPSVGTLAPLDVPADASHFAARTAWVWLPPIWFTAAHPALPALELLAGTPGTPTDWLRGGQALATLNGFARAHGGWGPVVVFADENGSLTGDTECLDTSGARAETYLTVDVVRELRRRFGVSSAPRHWIIAGSSEGGTCAIVLALRHPDLYAGFGDYSGDAKPNLVAGKSLWKLFDGSVLAQDAADPRWILTHHRFDGLRAGFVIGRQDDPRLLRATRELATLAARAGASTSFDELPGSHTFYVWSKALRVTLPWLLAPFAPAAAGST